MKKTGFRIAAAALGMALIVLGSTAAYATTIGNPLIDRPITDICAVSCIFINLQTFPTPGEQVTSWSFFNNNGAGQQGNQVMPLLLTQTGPSSFTVTGIGTTQTNQGTGIQSFAFGLVSGSDIVGANTVFGWQDVNNPGSIEFSDIDGTGTQTEFVDPGVPFGVGDTLLPEWPGSPWSRIYSVEFTAGAADPLSSVQGVPEPGTWVLFITGLVAVGALHGGGRRRSRTPAAL